MIRVALLGALLAVASCGRSMLDLFPDETGTGVPGRPSTTGGAGTFGTTGGAGTLGTTSGAPGAGAAGTTSRIDDGRAGTGTPSAGPGTAAPSGDGQVGGGPTRVCTPGETRCTGVELQQACNATGNWGAGAPCPFVCRDDRCGSDPKTVFVTSQSFQGGGIGGLDSADSVCNALAATAGLGGRFRAWLSDATGSPATRFKKNGGPYQLVDGTIVAANWKALTSKRLERPITLTEVGGAPPQATGVCVGPAVWSATQADGTSKVGYDCGNWRWPDGEMGGWGRAGSIDGWTDDCQTFSAGNFGEGDPQVCGSLAALYCFQQ